MKHFILTLVVILSTPLYAQLPYMPEALKQSIHADIQTYVSRTILSEYGFFGLEVSPKPSVEISDKSLLFTNCNPKINGSFISPAQFSQVQSWKVKGVLPYKKPFKPSAIGRVRFEGFVHLNISSNNNQAHHHSDYCEVLLKEPEDFERSFRRYVSLDKRAYGSPETDLFSLDIHFEASHLPPTERLFIETDASSYVQLKPGEIANTRIREAFLSEMYAHAMKAISEEEKIWFQTPMQDPAYVGQELFIIHEGKLLRKGETIKVTPIVAYDQKDGELLVWKLRVPLGVVGKQDIYQFAHNALNDDTYVSVLGTHKEVITYLPEANKVDANNYNEPLFMNADIEIKSYNGKSYFGIRPLYAKRSFWVHNKKQTAENILKELIELGELQKGPVL